LNPLRATVHQTDRAEQLAAHETLQKVGLRPCFQGSLSHCIASERTQHDDSCPRPFRTDRADGVNSIHLSHLQVHQRDIRQRCPELPDCLNSRGRFSHELHIRFRTYESCDAVQQQGVIVDTQYPYE